MIVFNISIEIFILVVIVRISDTTESGCIVDTYDQCIVSMNFK